MVTMPSIQLDLGATIWLSLGAVLVFLMIPAIGMLEAGLIRRRNVINGLMKGLLAAMVFLPIWFLVFPAYFKQVLVGQYPGGYLLTGSNTGVPDIIYAFFIGVFGAVTLALIFAGAPERVKFGGWIIFSVIFASVQWPLISGWIWGNGWLANLGSITGWAPGLGVRDFAGGTVVHAYAGIAGLAILLAIGPTLRRAPKNDPRNGKVRPEMIYVESIEAQNVDLPLAIIGTTLLWFGWYGFNGGSTVTVTQQTGFALANTSIAAALGGLVALILSRFRLGLWSPIMAMSGILGGLVAITPLAGFIDLSWSFFVGILAGLVTFYGIRLVERWYMIDDPVGSLPVHGFNGIMGSALVPVLANPSISGLTGLIYGGTPGWIATQLLGMAIALLFVFSTTYGIFKLLVKLGFRARVEEELAGLDVVDHGVRVG